MAGAFIVCNIESGRVLAAMGEVGLSKFPFHFNLRDSHPSDVTLPVNNCKDFVVYSR